MKGKIVSTDDVALLSFFYPDFRIRQRITPPDLEENIIYTGSVKAGTKEYLFSHTKAFIIASSGSGELDITTNEGLAKWVFEKKGKTLTESLEEYIQTIDSETLINQLKVLWLTGRWYKNGTGDTTLFQLFKDTLEGKKALITTYFKLQEVYPVAVIEASFLTFLTRVADLKNQSVSSYYMSLLIRANKRYGNTLSKALMSSFVTRSKYLRDDVALLRLLLEVG